ncbi:MAG: prepilin-type N-terminal cleavage/methylation domain-containing protein [Oceanicaulis sp.]
MPISVSRRLLLRSGYTLIEVVVAVAIAASVIALSAPSLIRSIERSQERQIIAGVISTLNDMRAQSVLDSRDMNSETVTANLQDALPEGWVLRVPEGFQLSRAGFCTGGEIQLETPRARVVVLNQRPLTPCMLAAEAV